MSNDKASDTTEIFDSANRVSEIVTQTTEVAKAGLGNDLQRQVQVARYAMPCRGYILAAMKFSDAAEDTAQDFIANKLASGYVFSKFKPGEGRFRDYLKKTLRNFVNTALSKSGKCIAQEVKLFDEFIADENGPWNQEFDRLYLQSVIAEVLDVIIAECSASGDELKWRVFCDYYLGEKMTWKQIDKQHELEDGRGSNLAEAMVRKIRMKMRQHPDYREILAIYRDSSSRDRKLEIEFNESDAFVLDTMKAIESKAFSESKLLSILASISREAVNSYEAITAQETSPAKLKAARKYFREQREKMAVEPQRKLACEILIHASTARAEVEFSAELSTISRSLRLKKYIQLAEKYPALRVTDWFVTASK